MRRETINRRCGARKKTIARKRSPEHLLFWRRARSMSIKLRISSWNATFETVVVETSACRNAGNSRARADAFNISPFFFSHENCSSLERSLDSPEESLVALFFPSVTYGVIRNSPCSINHSQIEPEIFYYRANVFSGGGNSQSHRDNKFFLHSSYSFG